MAKLHFDGLADNDDEGSLDDFLDGVLALPVSTRIRTFSLKCNHVAKYDDHINRCLCEVMVFILQIKVIKEGYYSLPLEIFTCKTVEKMKLGSGFAIDFLPADALLPALKTLSLDSFQALVSWMVLSGKVGNGLGLCLVRPFKD
uniref:F-box/LRR-repeat protein n=1 Tax=Noccaea caerulescens TaxID=107243 RepID=A0A1J3H1Y5_NOCCA